MTNEFYADMNEDETFSTHMSRWTADQRSRAALEAVEDLFFLSECDIIERHTCTYIPTYHLTPRALAQISRSRK